MSSTSHERMPSLTLAATPFWLAGFILLLCLIPLPFGGNRPWASDLFGVLIGIFLAMMVWQEQNNLAMGGAVPRKRVWLAVACFSSVVIWSFLQIVAWMPLQTHHPLWQEAMGILGSLKSSISIDSGLFPEALVRFVAYIGCFLMAFHAGRDAGRARKIVAYLAVAGALYAFYGLLVQAGGSNTILWYKKWAYEGFLTSTFVNKNSYAAYSGLGFLCSLAFLWEQFKDYEPKDRILARQSKSAAFIASLGVKDFFFLSLPVILLGALALTGSRAGAASSLFGVAVFFVAMALHRRWPLRRWGILLGLCVVIFGLFVGLGGDALLSRLGESKLDEDTSMRLAAYELVLQAIRDNPWFGFGLGSFDSAFHLYRDETLPLWFHHAHNDYIEMIMDLGLPVALLLFLGLGSLVSCCITGLRQRRKNGVYLALALGASALLGAHSFVDFSLHIPAVAATFATLLGIGVAQSWSSREGAAAAGKPRPAAQSPTSKRQLAPLRKITPVPLKKSEPLAAAVKAAQPQEAGTTKPVSSVIKAKEETTKKPVAPVAAPEKPAEAAAPSRQQKNKEKKETEPTPSSPKKKKGRGKKR